MPTCSRNSVEKCCGQRHATRAASARDTRLRSTILFSTSFATALRRGSSNANGLIHCRPPDTNDCEFRLPLITVRPFLRRRRKRDTCFMGSATKVYELLTRPRVNWMTQLTIRHECLIGPFIDVLRINATLVGARTLSRLPQSQIRHDPTQCRRG